MGRKKRGREMITRGRREEKGLRDGCQVWKGCCKGCAEGVVVVVVVGWG